MKYADYDICIEYVQCDVVVSSTVAEDIIDVELQRSCAILGWSVRVWSGNEGVSSASKSDCGFFVDSCTIASWWRRSGAWLLIWLYSWNIHHHGGLEVSYMALQSQQEQCLADMYGTVSM